MIKLIQLLRKYFKKKVYKAYLWFNKGFQFKLVENKS